LIRFDPVNDGDKESYGQVHKRTRREVKTWLQEIEEVKKSGNREGKMKCFI